MLLREVGGGIPVTCLGRRCPGTTEVGQLENSNIGMKSMTMLLSRNRFRIIHCETEAAES